MPHIKKKHFPIKRRKKTLMTIYNIIGKYSTYNPSGNLSVFVPSIKIKSFAKTSASVSFTIK